MRHEKSIFSPREERERKWLEERRADTKRAYAAVAEEAERIRAARRASVTEAFRNVLEPHRLGWFDNLSEADQLRLANGYQHQEQTARDRAQSDIQKDYDEDTNGDFR